MSSERGASGRLSGGETEAPGTACRSCRFWRLGLVLALLAMVTVGLLSPQ